MPQRWVEADHLRGPDDGRIWDVDYGAHPLLDPEFARRPSRMRRFYRLFYDRIRRDDAAYHAALASQFHPPGEAADPAADLARMAEYLREVDVYLRELIHLVPGALAARDLPPAPDVTASCDVRELLGIVFTAPSPRVRYEAQRKLYLAKLFLEIDQSRHVQDGPRHKAHFEALLEQGLWRHIRQRHNVEIGFNIDATGQAIEYNVRPSEGQQTWSFRSAFLESDGVSLDVLYYNCRFKRTVEPITYEIVDGRRRALERKRWGEMRRSSSGSIVSKMIRKGINNPDEITDIIGAMFIVHDDAALDDLLRLLDPILGSTIAWRNVVDTLAGDQDRAQLDRHSGRGYRVFKGDVDVLYPLPEAGGRPYRFPVEIQIYTLEGFLRTVCGAHDASHLALKLRQFLYGLLPKVFPRAIYGTGWLPVG